MKFSKIAISIFLTTSLLLQMPVAAVQQGVPNTVLEKNALPVAKIKNARWKQKAKSKRNRQLKRRNENGQFNKAMALLILFSVVVTQVVNAQKQHPVKKAKPLGKHLVNTLLSKTSESNNSAKAMHEKLTCKPTNSQDKLFCCLEIEKLDYKLCKIFEVSKCIGSKLCERTLCFDVWKNETFWKKYMGAWLPVSMHNQHCHKIYDIPKEHLSIDMFN